MDNINLKNQFRTDTGSALHKLTSKWYELLIGIILFYEPTMYPTFHYRHRYRSTLSNYIKIQIKSLNKPKIRIFFDGDQTIGSFFKRGSHQIISAWKLNLFWIFNGPLKFSCNPHWTLTNLLFFCWKRLVLTLAAYYFHCRFPKLCDQSESVFHFFHL
jgi:hypothetical protein